MLLCITVDERETPSREEDLSILCSYRVDVSCCGFFDSYNSISHEQGNLHPELVLRHETMYEHKEKVIMMSKFLMMQESMRIERLRGKSDRILLVRRIRKKFM